MTPNLALIGIQTPAKRGFRLWLPLFLLWVPVLLLAPLLFLALLMLCLGKRVNPWRAIAVCWAIVCSLPGTGIQVQTPKALIQVRVL
jgi:hypothetical protein